ncbi:MAG: cyclopropane-fatty-acyl-phospholipid synthase family protein [Acidobacteriota bacterium]|jgi:cyclopropane-fatty-acyl-phospholipid synthase
MSTREPSFTTVSPLQVHTGPRAADRPAPLRARLARRAVLARLDGLEGGELTIVEGSERIRLGRPADDRPAATVTVRDPRFWSAVAAGGSVGAGEAYAAGWWDADDLVAVVRLIARNRGINQGLERGLAAPRRLLGRLGHLLRVNSRAGSRVNVADHYDLGNELFAQFLDSSLTYSCAIFPTPGVSLERAQREKLDRICRALDLRPGDEVVEIGTGWGSFALHAAGEYGCRVTTTTISAAQHAYARERIDAAGLADRVTLLQDDYRDLPERIPARLRDRGRRFDKLVSIEMIEAVGEGGLDRYLRVIQDLLEPHGTALVQAILMADRHYAEYRTEPDLIQRLIFPGSHLPALSDLLGRMARSTDLTLTGLDDITPHYAETLARWRERFTARRERVRALGYSESFCRLWELYLCYCEGGFREGVVRDAQLLFARPAAAAAVLGGGEIVPRPAAMRCAGGSRLDPDGGVFAGVAG